MKPVWRIFVNWNVFPKWRLNWALVWIFLMKSEIFFSKSKMACFSNFSQLLFLGQAVQTQPVHVSSNSRRSRSARVQVICDRIVSISGFLASSRAYPTVHLAKDLHSSRTRSCNPHSHHIFVYAKFRSLLKPDTFKFLLKISPFLEHIKYCRLLNFVQC